MIIINVCGSSKCEFLISTYNRSYSIIMRGSIGHDNHYH